MKRIAGAVIALGLLLAFTAVGVVVADDGEPTTEETCRTLIEAADIDPSMDRNTLIPSCVDAVDNHGMDAQTVVGWFAITDFSTTLNRLTAALLGTATPEPTPASGPTIQSDSEGSLEGNLELGEAELAKSLISVGASHNNNEYVDTPSQVNPQRDNPNYNAYRVYPGEHHEAYMKWGSQATCGGVWQPANRFENGNPLPRNYVWRCEHGYWQLIFYQKRAYGGTLFDNPNAANYREPKSDGDIQWGSAGRCDVYRNGVGKTGTPYAGRNYRWLNSTYVGQLKCNWLAWTYPDGHMIDVGGTMTNVGGQIDPAKAPAGSCVIDHAPGYVKDSNEIWAAYHVRPFVTLGGTHNVPGTPGEAEIQRNPTPVVHANHNSEREVWEVLHPLINTNPGETRRHRGVDCTGHDIVRYATGSTPSQTFAVVHRVTELSATCNTDVNLPNLGSINLQWGHPHPDGVAAIYPVEYKESGLAHTADGWRTANGIKGGVPITAITDCTTQGYDFRVKAVSKSGDETYPENAESPVAKLTYTPDPPSS